MAASDNSNPAGSSLSKTQNSRFPCFTIHHHVGYLRLLCTGTQRRPRSVLQNTESRFQYEPDLVVLTVRHTHGVLGVRDHVVLKISAHYTQMD